MDFPDGTREAVMPCTCSRTARSSALKLAQRRFPSSGRLMRAAACRCLHIPLTFRKRGGRKLVVTPDGAEWAPRPRVDNAMVKALARAFRWRKMLDEGVHATLEDLARAKGVHATYVSRVLRLTLLAPEIVEAILDGRQPAELAVGSICCRGFRWTGRSSVPASDEALGGRSLHQRKCIGSSESSASGDADRPSEMSHDRPSRPHSARRQCRGDRIIEMAATYYHRCSDCDAID